MVVLRMYRLAALGFRRTECDGYLMREAPPLGVRTAAATSERGRQN